MICPKKNQAIVWGPDEDDRKNQSHLPKFPIFESTCGILFWKKKTSWKRCTMLNKKTPPGLRGIFFWDFFGASESLEPKKVVFFGYALAFWFGMTLKYNDEINPATGKPWQPGNIMAIFFCVFIGSFMTLGCTFRSLDFVSGKILVCFFLHKKAFKSRVYRYIYVCTYTYNIYIRLITHRQSYIYIHKSYVYKYIYIYLYTYAPHPRHLPPPLKDPMGTHLTTQGGQLGSQYQGDAGSPDGSRTLLPGEEIRWVGSEVIPHDMSHEKRALGCLGLYRG